MTEVDSAVVDEEAEEDDPADEISLLVPMSGYKVADEAAEDLEAEVVPVELVEVEAVELSGLRHHRLPAAAPVEETGGSRMGFSGF